MKEETKSEIEPLTDNLYDTSVEELNFDTGIFCPIYTLLEQDAPYPIRPLYLSTSASGIAATPLGPPDFLVGRRDDQIRLTKIIYILNPNNNNANNNY